MNYLIVDTCQGRAMVIDCVFLTHAFAGKFEDSGFDLGKSAVSSGPCYLARWKENHFDCGGAVGEFDLFQHSFLHRLHYGCHPGT